MQDQIVRQENCLLCEKGVSKMLMKLTKRKAFNGHHFDIYYGKTKFLKDRPVELKIINIKCSFVTM